MGKEYQEETSTDPRGVETRYLTSWCQGVFGADVVQKNKTWESRSHTTDVLLGS